jgi:hypothetical protein
MSFDPKEILEKVGGNDLVKGLSDKVGVGAEQAQDIAQNLLAKAQETGGGLLDNAEAVAAKLGVPVEKVQEIAGGLGNTLQEKAGQLGEFATGALGGVMAKLNESPLGGLMKGLDKDGDGNPINDITEGAKNIIGGIFGKKD